MHAFWKTESPGLTAGVETAHVLEVHPSGRSVRVRMEEAGGDALWARIALAGVPALGEGDEVLLAGSAGGQRYVIGVLQQRVPRPANKDAVALDNGTRAVVDGDDRLSVYDAKGGLLFQYEEGKARVFAETGDLDLVAPTGSINLVAGEGVNMTGQTVDISGRVAVRVAVLSAVRKLKSMLRLGPNEAALEGDCVRMRSRRTAIEAEKTDVRSERCNVHLEELRFASDRVQSTTGRIVAKAREVVQTVEGLLHRRAGREMTVIEDTAYHKARRTQISAEEDVRVQGEEIHLG
jgi:hypothetical protein